MRKKDKKLLSKEFLNYYLISSIPSMRWGLIANLLLFVVFAVINEVVFPDLASKKFFLKFGIIIPFFLLAIVVLYIRRLRPWLSAIFLVINLILCAAIFWVGFSSDTMQPGYEYYFAWVILMIIGLFTFYRLRFSTLLILGGLQLIAYLLATILNHSFRDHFSESLNNLFFILGASTVGFFIAYTFQLLNKKNFLHQKSLDAQYRRLMNDYKEKVVMEKELLEASQQKVIMMKEIHHRVKNNLAIVISMLSLQMRHNPNPELRKIIRDIEMRIRSMALIHEHLYRSENLNRIPLDQYLRSLSTIILSTFSASEINLDLDLDPLEASIETALPIGLITNELITNSVKYAFAEGVEGSIRLSLKRQKSNQIELVISDNGIGLPANFDFTKATTLGMFITRLLVEQLNAKLTVGKGNGASFSIVFTQV
ncbi:MAG: histidine kinase dimerization/phosphoacceptor domain -containing protein [bacterium]